MTDRIINTLAITAVILALAVYAGVLTGWAWGG